MRERAGKHRQNPKYKSAHPGKQQTDHCSSHDRQDGLAAFKPHFGKRVPFSANHSGAPWLEPIHQDANGEETRAGQAGRAGPLESLPGQRQRRSFNIHFVRMPITLAKEQGKEPPVDRRTA